MMVYCGIYGRSSWFSKVTIGFIPIFVSVAHVGNYYEYIYTVYAYALI